MKTTKLKIAIGLTLMTLALQTAMAWYDPSAGRWLTRDPIGEPGFEALRSATSATAAIPSAQSPSRWIHRDAVGNSSPQILAGEPNRYLSVRNNPINLVDTDGLQIAVPFPPIVIPRPDPISCAFAGGAAVGAGLCYAFPNTMTKPGEWIGNRMCQRNKVCTYLCVTPDGRAGIVPMPIPVYLPCPGDITTPSGLKCKLINGNPDYN